MDNNKKFELDDDMLDSVAGGVDQGEPRNDGLINAGTKCKNCRTMFYFTMADQAGATKIVQCPYCVTSHTVTFYGDRVSSELTYD